MNKFLCFFYACLVVVATVGGAGYLFYYDEPFFGVLSVALGVVLALGWFGVIELPTKSDTLE